ncbi:MAG: trypsin-like peptidase domain-containing protein [Candidatus Sungbacteria bacterium]|nr:trypsin-like peptidase domain-containing protein [Candidatus Sungbacteria bacterium]
MTHEESVIAAIGKTLPAVVSIVIGKDTSAVLHEIPETMWREIEEFEKKAKHHESREEIVNHLPRTDDGRVRVGNGSGFFVSSDGLIVTNKHVVSDANAEYTVITTSEDRYTARVLARDPLNDLAILKIEGDNLPFVKLGDSDNILLGQTVIALGNALGEFQNTVSAGIVSGLRRFLTAVSDDGRQSERLRGLIQTDAAINPGNSGGPLIDLKGAVIGINSAVVYGAENIGFATPINLAKNDLTDLKAFGKIKKPYLGIRYIPVTEEVKKRYKLSVDHGILVHGERLPGYSGVEKGSPAAAGGIREGDIILRANEKTLSEHQTLEDVLDSAKIGDELTLTVVNQDREEREVTLTLQERK